MPNTRQRKSSYPFKFRGGDHAILFDIGLYTKVQINRCNARCGTEPFYEYRYLEGKNRYRISHAFEHKFMTLDEYEAMKAEQAAEA